MALDSYALPKDSGALADLVQTHFSQGQSLIAFRRTMWLLAYYYMQGFRRFTLFDTRGARITAFPLDEEGRLEHTDQWLADNINKVAGKIAGLDLWPAVSRQDQSMSSIRERAVGQVIADAITSRDHLNKVQRDFSYVFAALGSCGVLGTTVNVPGQGLASDLEVVHPEEVLPFPALGRNMLKARGMMRTRFVTRNFLEEYQNGRLKAIIQRNRNKMYGFTSRMGTVVPGSEEFPTQAPYAGMANLGTPRVPQMQEEEMIRIHEVWIDGPRGTCKEYAITSGEVTLEHKVYEKECYCPLGFSRFMENGTFHGMGCFDLLYSESRAAEMLVKALINNIRNLDRYGVLVMPAGELVERAVTKDKGWGMRTFFYNPDPAGLEGLKPIHIEPHNAGEIPGKTASYLHSLRTERSPHRDILSEKGRVDSGAGMQFLDEQIQRALTMPNNGVQSAFGAAYRATVSDAVGLLTVEKAPLAVTKLSVEMAGVVIDQPTMTVQFVKNPLPAISKLSFSVRESVPRSPAIRKQEAISMLALKDAGGAGITDAMGLRIFFCKEGLDAALWMDGDRAAYDKIVQDILILYSDGITPQPVVPTRFSAAPDLQIRVLKSFMTSTTFSAASVAVQDQFSKYLQGLEAILSGVLPEQIPGTADEMVPMLPPGGGPGGPPSGMGGPPGAPPPAPPQ